MSESNPLATVETGQPPARLTTSSTTDLITLNPSARRLAMVVLCSGVFMASLDLFIVNMAFPTITHDFHGTSLASLSWILNAYTIVLAALLVPAGRWADLVGRRRIFIGGVALFTAGSILCGAASGVGLLIAARVVQAAGGAMLMPASLSLLLAITPTTAGRAKAIATWAAVGAVAAALGPLAGGALVEASWRWVFLVNLPFGVAALLLSSRALPESRDTTTRTLPDLLGTGLLAAAIGGLALTLVQAPSWGWESGRTIGFFIAVAIVLAVFVARSAHHHAPVVEIAMLRVSSFSGALFSTLLFYAAFGAFILSSVEFLSGVWGYSPFRVGLTFTPGPLMVLPFARLLAPRLAVRMGGPGRVAALGCFIFAGAWLWWLFVIQANPAFLTHLLPAQLVGGAGIGLAIPSLITSGTLSLPPTRLGAGSGVINMTRQIGVVIGAAAFVAILGNLDPRNPIPTFRAGIVLVIGFQVAAGLAALAIGRVPSLGKVTATTTVLEDLA